MSEIPNPAPEKGPRKVILPIIAIGALLYGGYAFVRSHTFNQGHVVTDDAYVTGDLVNVGPIVGGTISELKVDQGDFVKKGQLIGRLDDSNQKANLAQAEATYQAALTQVPQAKAGLKYQQLATQASIEKSKAALSTQNSRTTAARLLVNLNSDTIKQQVRQAESQVAQAQAVSAQARAGIETARAALNSAESAVATAERSFEATRSSIDAAQANADRTAKDLSRYETLLTQQAISKQQFDAAAAASRAANADLKASRERTLAAENQVEQARSAVRQAQSQVVANQKSFEASQKQIDVAKSSLELAKAGRGQIGISAQNAEGSSIQSGEARADLAVSEAGTEQVSQRAEQVKSASAQLLQAKAAVDNAKANMSYTYLYAPCDGYVVRKPLNVGSPVGAGQAVITITRDNKLWVTANFKETQLKDLKENLESEVEVDAVPGKKFKGHVLSILTATGSATTLLPPDNATGNFTKVVQRIPVKLSIEPGEGPDGASAEDLKRVRQGMSVQAVVKIHG